MNTAQENLTGCGSADETLRMMARLPAPQGLEERIQAALQAAPASRKVLAWPVNGWQSNGLRTAAAAVLAFVVAGGGWGVCLYVQPALSSSAHAEPSHLAAPGGFSSAGAMRTPQTLNGPLAPAPIDTRTRHGLKVQTKPAVKPALSGKTAKKKGETKPGVTPVQ